MTGRVLLGLGLNRNTSAVAAAGLLMALGEELWKRFLPKYLESSGAPLLAIGAYGSARDLLDGLAHFGLLWNEQPTLPLWLAAGFGLVGATVFGLTVDESSHFTKPTDPRPRSA